MTVRTVGELRESARRVLPGLNLTQVYLHDSSLTTHNRNLAPPFQVRTGVKVQARQQVDDTVEVWVRYAIDVRTQNADDTLQADERNAGLPVWTVNLHCVAVYEPVDEAVAAAPSEDGDETRESQDFDAVDLEAFALLVGVPTLHPYAREWTQTLSSHSQYPALTMGLMQSIAELPDDHEIDLDVDNDETDLPQ